MKLGFTFGWITPLSLFRYSMFTRFSVFSVEGDTGKINIQRFLYMIDEVTPPVMKIVEN